MAKCAFCHCPLEETQGNAVPSPAVAHAIGQGYSPEMSPSWQIMKETAARSVTDYEADCSDAVLAEKWKRQLTMPNRRFRICDSCFSTLFPYLPKNPDGMTDQVFAPSYERHDASHDAALGLIVPINTSVWAIFASYAALFSLLMVTAPVALILGIIALRDVRKNPQLRGTFRAIFAIVMGTIFTLILVGIIVFALIAGAMGW